MVKFLLPSCIEKNNIFQSLERFLDENSELPDAIEIDFSNLTFIRSPGVAFLSNFAHWLTQQGAKVSFINLSSGSRAIRYLDDSQFFKQHIGRHLNASSQCRPTTIPLRSVARSESHSWLETEFIPWIVNHSGLNKTSLAEVKTALQELFNNIDDHTEFEQGCVFGQWHPNEHRIIVSIADFGQGIPETVRRVEPKLDDNAAIIRAVDDGFSSMSLPTNRGAGLYLILLNIVQRFGGRVTIRSGAGLVEFENRSDIIYSILCNDVGFCIGTTIDLVIRTDQIPKAEEEEDFEWW